MAHASTKEKGMMGLNLCIANPIEDIDNGTENKRTVRDKAYSAFSISYELEKE